MGVKRGEGGGAPGRGNPARRPERATCKPARGRESHGAGRGSTLTLGASGAAVGPPDGWPCEVTAGNVRFVAGSSFEFSRVSGLPVSDTDLLGDLRRIAGELHKATVGQKEYRRLGRFDDTTVSRRFGSWNKSLEAAGLDLANSMNLSDEQLFENILALWSHYGRQPRRRELALPPSRVSQSPYLRRFGSWSAALAAFTDFANGAAVESATTLDGPAPRRGRRTPRDPSLRLRFRVLQRDRFACCACGASPARSPGIELHVDHILAWSSGGETTFENLQTLCEACNLGKGSLPGRG